MAVSVVPFAVNKWGSHASSALLAHLCFSSLHLSLPNLCPFLCCLPLLHPTDLCHLLSPVAGPGAEQGCSLGCMQQIWEDGRALFVKGNFPGPAREMAEWTMKCEAAYSITYQDRIDVVAPLVKVRDVRDAVWGGGKLEKAEGMRASWGHSACSAACIGGTPGDQASARSGNKPSAGRASPQAFSLL